MNEDDKRLLDSAYKALNISNLEELATMAGYAKTSVNNWYGNGFSDKARYKIKELIDKHSNFTTSQSTPPLHVNTISATKLSPHVSAGNGSNIESIDSVEKMGEFVLDVCTFKIPPTKKLYAMQVDGYSMTPMIFPDSWVVFDDTTQFKGDGLYVINWRNVLMVKLFQVNSEGMIRIVSANKEYESYTVSPDDQSVFRIFGKVLRTII